MTAVRRNFLPVRARLGFWPAFGALFGGLLLLTLGGCVGGDVCFRNTDCAVGSSCTQGVCVRDRAEGDAGSASDEESASAGTSGRRATSGSSRAGAAATSADTQGSFGGDDRSGGAAGEGSSGSAGNGGAANGDATGRAGNSTGGHDADAAMSGFGG